MEDKRVEEMWERKIMRKVLLFAREQLGKAD